MPRFFVVLVMLALFAPNAARGEPGQNLLPNPGFEEGMKFWLPYSDGNGDVALDDAISHSGGHALRLTYHKNADTRLGSYVFASNQLPAVLKPGQVYTLSAWIKIAGVPPGKGGPVAYLCEANPNAGTSPPVSGNTDPAKNNGWVFISFRYKVPKDAGGYQFRCQCHASSGMAGSVWFDDLKLEEGDQPSAFRPDWIDASELYSQEPEIPWLPVPVEFRCSSAIVTPHVDIARPYAGGSLRVLWAGFYNNARAACELAQRGDLVLDSVVLNGSSTDAAGVRILHERCVDVFRERLGIQPKLSADRAPQALVIEQGTFELLDQQDRAAILDRVRRGMGCVVLLGPIHVSGHPGAIVTPKIRELIDAAQQSPEPGHGHVFTMLNVGQDPAWDKSTLGIETLYGDMLQYIYRSIGRPTARVAAMWWPPQPIANMPWKATVTGLGSLVRVRVVPDLPTLDTATLMDGHGVALARSVVADVWAKTDGPASPATRLAMRPLPAGKYMLLAQILDDRKQVLGWSLSPFSVVSSVQIVKLDPGAATFLPHQPLHISCTVKNQDKAFSNARIDAQITDWWGRILLRSSTPISIGRGETTHDLALTLTHAERCSVRLSVMITADDMILAKTSAWLSTEKLMPKVDFHVGPYDDLYNGWSFLGADMLVGPPRPDLALRPFPWLDLPRAMGADGSCCNAESLEKATNYLVSSLSAAAPWTPLGCILNDEQDRLGFGARPDPHEVAFFRRYLQETYKDLSALNASWGAAYTTWDDINADAAAINFITESDRNPAPWADWYAASEQAAHRFYSALATAARIAIPDAQIGISGTRDTSGVNGIDWWLLAHDFRSVCLYHNIHAEMYRSFAGPENLMTSWSHLAGAIDDPDGCRVRVWHDLFAHCGGAPVYGGRWTNMFYPDYRAKPGIIAYTDDLASIRGGIGRLILGARRNDAAVAIFYSPACYRARIVAMKDNEHYHAADAQNDLLASLSAALYDLRIGSRFIAYEQIARGELDSRNTKVLFLWGALALTVNETAAIRRYIEDGGVVIADSEPGLYDEHCHKRSAGSLHDCLPPDDSEVRNIGKGKFILYRGPDSGYAKTHVDSPKGVADASATGAASRSRTKFFDLLMRQAGLKPNFRILDSQGHELALNEPPVDFVDGPARYVACIGDGKFGHSTEVRLNAGSSGHLYDSRAGKYLGPAGERSVNLVAATGNLFALLPYQVDHLEMASPPTASLGQPIDVKVLVKIVGGPIARHVIVLQLRRPDGKDLPQYRWIVETDNGAATTQLFLALNDPLGRWTLLARDVATGVQKAAAIEIRADAAPNK